MPLQSLRSPVPLLAALALAGCTPTPPARAPEIGEMREPRPLADVRCEPLRGPLAPAFHAADSLLVRGEIELALDAYARLAEEAADCGVLAARRGDAHQLRGRTGAALDAYAEAAALDACGSGAAGLAAMQLPTRTGTEARLEAIAGALRALEGCGPLEPAALSVRWRVELLLGRNAEARATRDRLAAVLPPAAHEYGANLMREAGPGSILVTGSDVETDLALVAARGLGRRAPIVVDLELLHHPAYIEERMSAGLDVGLGPAEVRALVPERRGGGVLTIGEQALDHLLVANGHAPARPAGDAPARSGALRADARRVVFSHRASAEVVYALSPRLSLTGLVLALDGGQPGTDVEAIAAHARALEVDALARHHPVLGHAESLYRAAETQRLLAGYATSALKGAVAAFQRGRHATGRTLFDFARARGDEVGLSAETLSRFEEIGAYAEQSR